MLRILEEVWRGICHGIKAIWNFFVGLFSGKDEIELICARPAYDVDMLFSLRRLVLHSDKFKDIKLQLYTSERLEPREAASLVLNHARIRRSQNRVYMSLIEENLAKCFQDLGLVNDAMAHIRQRTKKKCDREDDQDEAGLEQLWEALKPGIRRRGGKFTKEWGEIGFQGENPATDFRSMGMFALDQLLYFALNRTKEARVALEHSNHPVRWYPFSAVGINLSSHIISLLEKRELDERILLSSGRVTGDRTQRALDEINEIYCDLFLYFDRTWIEEEPEDAMAFPRVFQKVKDKFRP